MSDTLRTRIAAVLDKAIPESASDVGFYQRFGVTPLVDIEAYDLNLESLADAVIRELNMDCIYRYACAHCGDFWFDKSERMQRFALLHGKSHDDD